MKKRLHTFRRLSFRRQWLLPLTMGLSLYSYLLLRYLGRYARFGRAASEVAEAGTVDARLVADLRYALRKVARHAPWPNVCRHQAYQARLLCRLFGVPYRIFVGFKKNEQGRTEGHAWTVVGSRQITGFCNPSEYLIQAVWG